MRSKIFWLKTNSLKNSNLYEVRSIWMENNRSSDRYINNLTLLEALSNQHLGCTPLSYMGACRWFPNFPPFNIMIPLKVKRVL